MSTVFIKKSTFRLFPTQKRLFRKIFPALLSVGLGFCLPLVACKNKSVNLMDSVSELRDNLLLAQNDELSLRVYSVTREVPYLADGIRRELSQFSEFRIVAPAAYNRIDLAFEIGGKHYGGDTSYDNVKSEYFYSCNVDLSGVQSLPITLIYQGNKQTLTALSVKTERTISPQQALNAVYHADKDFIDEKVDKYGFIGEIHVRLIYEENAYYYVGFIEKNGRTTAYLLNAENEKILAKRES
jgi:hypothetical protein